MTFQGSSPLRGSVEASPLSCLPILHGQSEMPSLPDAQVMKSFSSPNGHIPFVNIVGFFLKKITFVYFLFKFLVLENVNVSTVFKLSSFPLSFIFSCIPHFFSKYQSLLTYYCYTHTLLSQFTVAHMYVCVRLKIWDWITS